MHDRESAKIKLLAVAPLPEHLGRGALEKGVDVAMVHLHVRCGHDPQAGLHFPIPHDVFATTKVQARV